MTSIQFLTLIFEFSIPNPNRIMISVKIPTWVVFCFQHKAMIRLQNTWNVAQDSSLLLFVLFILIFLISKILGKMFLNVKKERASYRFGITGTLSKWWQNVFFRLNYSFKATTTLLSTASAETDSTPNPFPVSGAIWTCCFLSKPVSLLTHSEREGACVWLGVF